MGARTRLQMIALAALLAACGACSRKPPPPPVVDAPVGDEIVACGQRFAIGTPVVLWSDPRGYDGYALEPRFPDELTRETLKTYVRAPRYSPVRENVSPELQKKVLDRGWKLDELRSAVDQFVIHFDVCGTSRRCFKVLHDQRALSVHFLLDVDGTIYQTLDLQERAWHAKQANDRSVGVEIANIGAYTSRKDPAFTTWYAPDSIGWHLIFPADLFPAGTGIRTPDFLGRPARPGLVVGPIHGASCYQFDYTAEQYAALARLCAGLHRVFPKIALDAPRGKDGQVLTRELSPTEFARHRGLIGHYHITDDKTDPGPAFDWERVIAESRALVP